MNGLMLDASKIRSSMARNGQHFQEVRHKFKIDFSNVKENVHRGLVNYYKHRQLSEQTGCSNRLGDRGPILKETPGGVTSMVIKRS